MVPSHSSADFLVWSQASLNSWSLTCLLVCRATLDMTPNSSAVSQGVKQSAESCGNGIAVLPLNIIFLLLRSLFKCLGRYVYVCSYPARGALGKHATPLRPWPFNPVGRCTFQPIKVLWHSGLYRQTWTLIALIYFLPKLSQTCSLHLPLLKSGPVVRGDNLSHDILKFPSYIFTNFKHKKMYPTVHRLL